MKTMIKLISGVLLTLTTYSAAGADAQGIRHEIELFLTSGVGNIVLIILILLLLLWLLLPLAVFGLKTRLNTLIRENKELTSASKETARTLSDIRDELVALKKEETTIVYTNQPDRPSDEDTTENLMQENNNLNRKSEETNRILAEIRDILAALSEEETAEDSSEQPESKTADETKIDIYKEIKFDP